MSWYNSGGGRSHLVQYVQTLHDGFLLEQIGFVGQIAWDDLWIFLSLYYCQLLQAVEGGLHDSR